MNRGIDALSSLKMKEKIRKFIVENFLFGKRDIKDDQMLFEEGIIDSFGFVVLLSFIEKEFNIYFDRSEIMMENFNSIDHIVKSIEEKKAKKND